MKILHTSDWHVGKVLKGRPRIKDQIAALGRVVEVARQERPDLVIVSGDLYDTGAPTPEAQRVVTRALTALRGTGADIVAIGGNHDNGAALDALRPWADAAGISLRGSVTSPDDLLISGATRDGEQWRVAALPFLSQRYAVRASEMFDLTEAEAAQTYADHVARLIARLAEGFGDGVNLVAAHLTVVGGLMGGGEREAHTILGYAVPSSVFPASAHYVALGHLHRPQAVVGPCPIRYSGSPLAVDFGEESNTCGVTIVDVTAGTAAKAREVPVEAGSPLRTVRGTLAELAELAEQGIGLAEPGDGSAEPDTSSGERGGGEALLRVYVTEAPRAGLREEVQALLPQALEIRIDPALLPQNAAGVPRQRRAGRSPADLFSEYLTQRGHADEATTALFHRLYEEAR